MGVKIFRDDNWHRITNGVIFRRDIMGLDRDKDRELIRYLLLHAPSECGMSMLDYAAEKYGSDGMPEPLKNIDDPGDTGYEEYFVLQEQAARENDPDILKEAALYGADYNMAAFAFCRLTGYHWPPDDCDAFSYRTFRCDLLPGMDAERIREFCGTVIENGSRFKNAAEECLRRTG